MQGERVARVLDGIKRSLASRDQAIRETKARALDLTPAILGRLAPIILRDDAGSTMCWAAANLGTYGVLRIGELLTSKAHPERALKEDRVLFRNEANQAVHYLPCADEIDESEYPHHFRLDIGMTKTGIAAPRFVAARPAVEAMWRWIHVRRDLARKRGTTAVTDLFRMPGEAPLTLKSLTGFLQDQLESLGLGRPQLTGKAFRRGGASSLVAGNVPRRDAANAGGWASTAMLEVYASDEAKERRAIAVSRAMEPAH
jgi:hypothetical protein